MKSLIMALAIVAMASGCKSSTGFDRGAINERFATQKREVTDADIQKALEKKAQIRFPIKVAVALSAETSLPYYDHHYRVGPEYWRWTVPDTAQITDWTEQLKAGGVVSDVFVVSDLVREGSDLKSLRLAAAQHGADVLLQIQGVAQVDRYHNPLAILNLLILPGYVVPSTHSDVLFVMHGALWDVGNEYLYATVEAEAEVKKFGATFKLDDEKVVNEAKRRALKDFGEEFIMRVQALKAK